MTTKTFTADVEVGLDEWDDDELVEELERRNKRGSLQLPEGFDANDLAECRDLFKQGRDSEASERLRQLVRNYFGLAFL